MNFVLGYALSMTSKFLKPVLKTPSVGVCGTSWKWIRIGTFSSAASSYILRSSGPAASTWNPTSPSPGRTALHGFGEQVGCVRLAEVRARELGQKPSLIFGFQRLHLLRGVGARQRAWALEIPAPSRCAMSFSGDGRKWWWQSTIDAPAQVTGAGVCAKSTRDAASIPAMVWENCRVD